MKRDTDCRIFEDQLDALLDGSLPEEGMRHLRLHALACPDCATALKTHGHLALPSLEELEGDVPEDLLASLGPRVEAAVRRRRPEPSTRRRAWTLPTLAAASLVLLLSTVSLLVERSRLEARVSDMARQIGELQTGLGETDGRAEWVERTAGLAGGDETGPEP